MAEGLIVAGNIRILTFCATQMAQGLGPNENCHAYAIGQGHGRRGPERERDRPTSNPTAPIQAEERLLILPGVVAQAPRARPAAVQAEEHLHFPPFVSPARQLQDPAARVA